MKDFVSYQKMTYETMEEVRRLFADISVQKEDNNIYLSGGKSAQSAGTERICGGSTQTSGGTERASGSTSGGDEQKYEEYFQKPER